jgi:hypothetical protein
MGLHGLLQGWPLPFYQIFPVRYSPTWDILLRQIFSSVRYYGTSRPVARMALHFYQIFSVRYSPPWDILLRQILWDFTTCYKDSFTFLPDILRQVFSSVRYSPPSDILLRQVFSSVRYYGTSRPVTRLALPFYQIFSVRYSSPSDIYIYIYIYLQFWQSLSCVFLLRREFGFLLFGHHSLSLWVYSWRQLCRYHRYIYNNWRYLYMYTKAVT